MRVSALVKQQWNSIDYTLNSQYSYKLTIDEGLRLRHSIKVILIFTTRLPYPLTERLVLL